MSSHLNKNNDLGVDPINVMLGISLALAAFIFIGWYIWTHHHLQLKHVSTTCALYTRYLHYPFLWLYSDSYQQLIKTIPQVLSKTNVDLLSYDQFEIFLWINLKGLSYLLVVISTPFSIYLFKNWEKIAYCRMLNLDSLIEVHRKLHPRIRPATNQNLLKLDPRFGAWATHLNPLQVSMHMGALRTIDPNVIEDDYQRNMVIENIDTIKKTGLPFIEDSLKTLTQMRYREYNGVFFPVSIVQDKNDCLKTIMTHKQQYFQSFSIDLAVVQKYMTESLGPKCVYVGPYIDINILPPPERAIWMLLTCCLAQDKAVFERIDQLLDQTAETFSAAEDGSPIEINLAGYTELYNSIKNNLNVKIELTKIAKHHGYYYTAFSELWLRATDSFSRIITRDFIWLKPVNRILYLSLSQQGMEVARPECSAIRCHYNWEKRMGKRILKPKIERAILNRVNELEEEGWLRQKQTSLDDIGKAQWIGNEVPSLLSQEIEKLYIEEKTE